MKKTGIFFVYLFINTLQINAQNQWPVQIDSINIQKNWRTKAPIILNELKINPGSTIDKKQLEQGITRIWNIGNFSNVTYRIDSVGQKTVLTITAKDALTIMPIFSFSGNKDDYKLTLGVEDNNFLGKNIRAGIVGSYGTNVKDFRLNTAIPRQLLYRNMALSGNINYGRHSKQRYKNGEKISGVNYTGIFTGINITNPFHEDFFYTFSPDLGLSYFQHKTDSIYDYNNPDTNGYTINFIRISTSESIGYIKRMRHQRDGYHISIHLSGGIGLDTSSPSYISTGLYAGYHKLFNRVIQLSAYVSTAYTSSNIPSLIYHLGNNRVKGILYGEISGKTVYSAYVGGHFTYLNNNWFAIEHSVFVNWGNGTDHLYDLFKTSPLASVGTGVKLMVPMIPWLNISFYYTIGNGSNTGFSLQL